MKHVLSMLALVVLLALPLTVTAQEAIPLEPVTIDAFGITTIVPAGWTEVGPGLYARASSPTDGALVALQSALIRADGLLQAILPQLGLTEAPEPVGEITTDTLTWTLYQVDVEVPQAGTIRVDIAIAQGAGASYVLIVQSLADEYEALHEQVFLPVLAALTPTSALVEATSEPVERAYAAHEVTFPGGADEVMLAGTLTVPEGSGPFPALVLVSGSGPQDRDESIAGTAMRPFALLADALTSAGVAVLRYDDRGVGESTGRFDGALTSDFAADAAAAIAWLATRDEIDPAQIGVLGHSEGGAVAAMLGADDAAAFIVSLAGPGVNGIDILRVQNLRLLEAEGATQAQIDAQLAIVEAALPPGAAGQIDEAEPIIRELATAAWSTLDEATQAQFESAEQYADLTTQAVISQLSQPWFASFLNLDPGEYWAQTTAPVLAIFGELDVQVDAEQNAAPLEAALAEAGNEDVTIVVLPGANHLFQAAETGSLSEYAALPGEFTPDLIPTLVDWLLDHVTRAE